MDEMTPPDDHPICAERTYRFSTRDRAWAFQRHCDDHAGWLAGYPMPVPAMEPSVASIREYTVRVYRAPQAQR